MLLEDTREQENKKEVFPQLLKETLVFKIDLPLIKDLQKRYELVEWKERVGKVIERTKSKDE